MPPGKMKMIRAELYLLENANKSISSPHCQPTISRVVMRRHREDGSVPIGAGLRGRHEGLRIDAFSLPRQCLLDIELKL